MWFDCLFFPSCPWVVTLTALRAAGVCSYMCLQLPCFCMVQAALKTATAAVASHEFVIFGIGGNCMLSFSRYPRPCIFSLHLGFVSFVRLLRLVCFFSILLVFLIFLGLQDLCVNTDSSCYTRVNVTTNNVACCCCAAADAINLASGALTP